MGQSKMLIINIAPKQEHNAIIKAIKYPEYPKYSHGEWANLIIITYNQKFLKMVLHF